MKYQFSLEKAFGLAITSIFSFMLGSKLSQKQQLPDTCAFNSDPNKQKNIFSETLAISPILTKSYPNMTIVYSKYFKSPLLIHQTIDLSNVEAKDQQINNDSFLKQIQTWKSNILHQKLRQGIWTTLDRYAKDLVLKQTCQSVQIYSGPIYSKDKPYKANDPQWSQIYKLGMKSNKEGVAIPDKIYKIIKCNRRQSSYFNAFRLSNSGRDVKNQKIIDMTKPLNLIEKQIGIKFKFTGKPLTSLQFDKLNQNIKYHQEQYHNNQLKKGKSVKQIYNTINSAQAEGVKLNKQQNILKIQQIANKQIKQLQQNKNLNVCYKIGQIMKIYKLLIQLNQLKDTKSALSELQLDCLNECLAKKEKKDIQSMKQLSEIKKLFSEGYTLINSQLKQKLIT